MLPQFKSQIQLMANIGTRFVNYFLWNSSCRVKKPHAVSPEPSAGVSEIVTNYLNTY
jgi:hypothetical protein